ncbi:MAG: ABC transporter substrate-binding protein [Calditrichia bacterium]
MKCNGFYKTIVLLTFFFCFACQQNEETNHDGTASQPTPGGTLIVGIPQDIDTFNPLFSESMVASEITHLLLPGLADLDAKSRFVPQTSSSWKYSDGGKKLTYFLHKNVRWTDGTPLTASDVVFTYELLKDERVGSPKRQWVELIEKVEAIDSFQVMFTFAQPYPLSIFDTAGEILPRHYLINAERTQLNSHAFGREPLSFGPYFLKRWKTRQFIELAANDNFFRASPFLKSLFFKVIPDENNLLIQLQTGEIDMAIDVPVDKVKETVLANPNLNVYPLSGRLYYYLGYNEAQKKFASTRVRRALTMAVNRQMMIDALLDGYGRICLGPIPPMLSWAYNDTIQEIPFNQQQAKKLLAEEGWIDSDGDGWLDKDGDTFNFVLNTDAGNGRKKDIAVVIQDQLRQIGVKVDINLLEWGSLINRLGKRDFEAYIGGWNTPVYIDPTPIFHSSSVDLFNHGGYANSRVDELIEQGREELDQNKAGEIWKELQAIIYSEQHYNFLFWVDRLVLIDKRFKNVTPIPLSALYNIENWYDASQSLKHLTAAADGD